MKGLDAYITGHEGRDHPDNRKPCKECEEQAAVKRGLCRDCYDAGLEDYHDGLREERRIDTAGLEASIATCDRVSAALRAERDSIPD